MSRSVSSILPLALLFVALLGFARESRAQTTWSGIDTERVYVMEGHVQVVFAFDPVGERVMASTYRGKLGSLHAVGHIADAKPVNDDETVFGIDVLWDDSLGTLFSGRSLFTVTCGEVVLDGDLPLTESSAVERSDLDALFAGTRPKEAEVAPSALKGDHFVSAYASNGPFLLVLASGMQVVLLHDVTVGGGDDGVLARGWIHRHLHGDSGRIRWESAESAPSGERWSSWLLENGTLSLDPGEEGPWRLDQWLSPSDWNSRIPGVKPSRMDRIAKSLADWDAKNQPIPPIRLWHGWARDRLYTQVNDDKTTSCVWVEPELKEVHVVHMKAGGLASTGQEVRGAIVETATLFSGELVTYVVWGDGDDGFGRFVAREDHVAYIEDSGGASRPEGLYALEQDSSVEMFRLISGRVKAPKRPVWELAAPTRGETFESGVDDPQDKLFAVVLPGGAEVVVGTRSGPCQKHALRLSGAGHFWFAPSARERYALSPQAGTAWRSVTYKSPAQIFFRWRDRSRTLGTALIEKAGLFVEGGL